MKIKENIKLVIWDLDETFWNGTIAEGEVEINQKALEAVKSLNERGIINTIVSNNNYEIVKEKLINEKCWEHFILPSISYEPKGERIRSLIKKLNFRPSNVMFIDDNYNNLMEAQYYNPEISVLSASKINNLLDYPELLGKKDLKLSRFNQYKHLEVIIENKKSYDSNIDFLRQSEIKIFIANFNEKSSSKDIDRAHELIKRTNQLNFTKNKISKESLLKLTDEKKFNSGLVSLKDKYGDYGVIGFYSVCLSTNKLFQFVFSCRVINIGVESFIFQHLNKPKIDISKDVIVDLYRKKNIDWITFDNSILSLEKKSEMNVEKKIYFKGGCDLTGILRHIHSKAKLKIIEDTNYLSEDGLDIRNDHTYLIINSHTLSSYEIDNLCKNIPFFDKNTFNKNIFLDNDVIIFSVLMDYTQYVFENKLNGIRISLGPFNFASNNINYQNQILSYFNKSSNVINSNFLKYFRNNYNCLGKISPKEFYQNLNKLKNFLNKDTQVIFLNGAEIDVQDDIFYESDLKVIDRHRLMNQVLDKVISSNNNFHLVDIRKFAKSNEHLNDSIRHYEIGIYNEIAIDLAKIINDIISNKNMIIAKKFTYKYISKIIRLYLKKFNIVPENYLIFRNIKIFIKKLINIKKIT